MSCMDRIVGELQGIRDEIGKEKAAWETSAALSNDAEHRKEYTSIAEGLQKAISIVDRRIEEIEKEVE